MERLIVSARRQFLVTFTDKNVPDFLANIRSLACESRTTHTTGKVPKYGYIQITHCGDTTRNFKKKQSPVYCSV